MLRLIINPHAARGQLAERLPRLVHVLQRQQVPFTQHVTDTPQQVNQLVQDWNPQTDVLAAVGGDGTVQSVGRVAAATGFRMAIVPFGSANDFASCLGWSSSPEAAVRRLSEPSRPVDLGELQGHGAFVNGLGMGFDALAGKLSYHAPARLTGMPRYAWAAAQALRQTENHTVTVVADGQQIYQGKSCLVSVMNSTRYGGGFRVAPQAHPADGYLDVVVAKGVSRSTLASVLPLVVMGQHTALPFVLVARASQVQVHWDRPQVCHLDGEMLEDRTTCEVTVRPGALQLAGRLRAYP